MRNPDKMKDFRFSGDDGFWDYRETCRRAKLDGIEPVENPGPSLLGQVQKVLDRVLPIYVDLIPQSDKPLRLRGVFLYDPSAQTADLKTVLGVAVPLDNGDAVIGLATTLGDLRTIDLSSYVFLHECAHLCSNSDHNEEFAETLNTACIGFFTKDARMDSAAVRLYHQLCGWHF